MMVSCSLCTSRFHSLSLLLTHIRLEHADQPNFQIQCYLQGCQRTFKKFTAYRNHIYQYHDTLYLDDEPDASSEDDNITISDPADTLFDKDFHHEPVSTAKHKSSCLSIDKLQDAAARWILKTSECHKVPQSVMDDIISDVRGLFDTGRLIVNTS